MIYNAYTDMFILLRSKMIVDSHNIISADTIDPEFYENAMLTFPSVNDRES